MENRDEECTCHTGRPPCSFCTDHCVCEKCGRVVRNDEVDENLICEDCWDEGNSSNS